MSQRSLHQQRSKSPRLTYGPLVLIATAVCSGIVLDRFVPLSASCWFAAIVIAGAAWFSCFWRHYERLASLLLLLAVLFLGAAWHHAWWRLYPASDLSRFAREIAQPTCLEALALTSPRWIPEPAPSPLRTIPATERSELLVWVTAIRHHSTFVPTSGRAELLVAGPPPEICAGDRLRIYAHLSRAAQPLNPGEPDFAWYQRAERVSGRLFADFPNSVERLSRGSPWSLRRALADLRASGIKLLQQHINPSRAGLASAVLLGAREQLDPDQNENYLVTGTIHILSISGLHVGILAAICYAVFNSGLVSRHWALMATVFLTIGYAIMTDLQPPVVRAAALVSVTALALWQGRLSYSLNALAAALLFVLLLNPASLFQTGTQLSFLAVATMFVCAPLLSLQRIDDPLDRLIAATRPWPQQWLNQAAGALWRLWLTGAFIWLVSLPLVWQQFHLISPVALVLNCLIWLPVAIAMVSGLATLLVGGLIPPLGALFGWVCDGSLALLEWLVAWGRDWPAAFFWLPAPPVWCLAIFYGAVAAWFLVPRLRPGGKCIVASAAVWSACALYLSSSPVARWPWATSRPLTCSFISVGHGLGVLIELPDGRNLLYDSGRLGSPLAAVRPMAAALWSRGITHLDAVVISHADADHYNALPGLLDRFGVGAVYVSPVMFDSRNLALDAFHAAIVAHGIPLRELQGGQQLAAGPETAIHVLHPTRRGVYGSDNANSIVLLMEHAGRRVLLTGDLEPPGLDDVLAEEPLDCDVVLAPHHGSPRSSPGRFADWCQPNHVVISGRRNVDDARSIQSVKDSFRLRGAEVYHTAADGCVTAQIHSRGLRIFTHRPHVRAAPSVNSGGNLLQTD